MGSGNGSTPRAPFSVAVVGATGSVGRDLITTLGRTRLPISDWDLRATHERAGETFEIAGRRHLTRALPEEPGTELDAADLVLFATPPDVTRAHAPALAARGVRVIDIGAALSDQAPLIVPAADPRAVLRAAASPILCSPGAPTVLLSAVLAPLAHLGAVCCRGTAIVSAGTLGRAAVGELSAQVIAMFNQKEAPQEIFPSGLAFDLHPETGPTLDGWTTDEQRLSGETSQILGWDEDALSVTVVRAPLFAGVGLSLHVEFERCPDLETIERALTALPGMEWTPSPPGMRELVGRSRATIGRLRADPCGEGIVLWAAADNLRFGASANATAIAATLWQAGLLVR